MSEIVTRIDASNIVDWNRMISFVISKKGVENALERPLCVGEYVVCSAVSLCFEMKDASAAIFLSKKHWSDVVQRASACQGAQTVSTCTSMSGQAKALTMQHAPLPPVTISKNDNNTVCFPLPFEFQGDSAWSLDLTGWNGIEVILKNWNQRDPALKISKGYLLATYCVRENPVKRIVEDHGPVSFYAHHNERSFTFPLGLLTGKNNNETLRYIYSTIVCDPEEPQPENFIRENVFMTLCLQTRSSVGAAKSDQFAMASTFDAWIRALRNRNDAGKTLAERASGLASLPAFVWTNGTEGADFKLTEIESASIAITLSGKENVAFCVETVCVYDKYAEEQSRMSCHPQ